MFFVVNNVVSFLLTMRNLDSIFSKIWINKLYGRPYTVCATFSGKEVSINYKARSGRLLQKNFKTKVVV